MVANNEEHVLKKHIEKMVNDLLSMYSKYFQKEGVDAHDGVSVVLTSYNHLLRVIAEGVPKEDRREFFENQFKIMDHIKEAALNALNEPN